MKDAIRNLIWEITSDTSTVELTSNEVSTLNSNPVDLVANELLWVLNDSSNSVIQSRAFKGLLALENFDRVRFLMEYFDSATGGWRSACVRNMSQFHDHRIVDKLTQILLGDDDENIRFIAAETLGKVGDRTAIEALNYASTHDLGEDFEGFTIAEEARKSLELILLRNGELN